MNDLPQEFKNVYEGIVRHNKIDNFIPSQDWAQIKQKHSIQNRFTDTEFRATNESIFFTQKFKSFLQQRGLLHQRSNQIVWKRAKDMYLSQAHFVLDKQKNFMNMNTLNESNYRNFFHTTDLDQGNLGDCWFVSAASGIIQNYNLFRKVVPFDNSLEDSEYCGAFHFRFWIYGEWKDIVVDDYLPVGPDNKLIFLRNQQSPNEFWGPLLEKAYAKLYGSYEALDGGLTIDALIDMSGGLEEVFNLKEIRKTLNDHPNANKNNNEKNEKYKMDHIKFWEVLLNAKKKYSVVGCTIEHVNARNEREVKLHNGLVGGHAYICTRLCEFKLNGEKQRIIRIYNPWGNEVEWNGKWSDNSSIWGSVDPIIKDKLELKIAKDGEFWMSFEDWLLNFDKCQICNLTPHLFDTNLDLNKIYKQLGQNPRSLSNIFSMWQCQLFHDKWIKGVSSGGRGEPRPEKFFINPQITFCISSSDLVNNEACLVIIGLMQMYTRRMRVALRVDSAEEHIQFRLFKVRDQEKFFRFLAEGEPIPSRYMERIGSSGDYLNKREVTRRFSLTQGAYVIIPSCYENDKEGEFLVRIFTEMPLQSKYYIENI